MSTDFDYNGKQIVSGGPFKPGGKNMPLDARTRINTYSEKETIPNPFVGMIVTVLTDEKNNNKMTDYKVKSLKANSAGIANMVIDEMIPYVDYLGVSGGSSGGGSGEGLTSEQSQQLTVAYNHSQEVHVQPSDIPTKVSQLENDNNYTTLNDVTTAINNAQLGGVDASGIDLTIYQTKEDITLKTTDRTVAGAINEVNGKIYIGSDEPTDPNTIIWAYNIGASSNSPNIVIDSTPSYIEEGSSVTLGVKLSSAPSSNQVVNVRSQNGILVINKSSLMFTSENYSEFQYVKVEHTIDENTTDDVDVLILSTVDDKYIEINLQLLDSGEGNDSYTYESASFTELYTEKLNTIEGTAKDIIIYGNSEGIGKLNDSTGKYDITLVSSNGGTITDSSKFTRGTCNFPEVGSTFTYTPNDSKWNYYGFDTSHPKISAKILSSNIKLMDINESNVVVSRYDYNTLDKGTYLNITNKLAINLPFYNEGDITSLFNCYIGIKSDEKHTNKIGLSAGTPYKSEVVDTIKFKLPQPLRANSDNSVRDTLSYNKSKGHYELIQKVDESGQPLDAFITHNITDSTKSTINTYEGETFIYLQSGDETLITCLVPNGVNAAASSYSLSTLSDDSEESGISVLSETTSSSNTEGLYLKIDGEFTPIKLRASNIIVKDVNGNFSSKSVEGVLNELATNSISDLTFNDINGTVPVSKLPMDDLQNNLANGLEVTVVSKLKGKNIICDGDSITVGSFVTFTNGTYPTILANKTGANVENVACAGDEFIDSTTHLSNSKITNPDIITFLFGANDVTGSIAAGSASDVSADCIAKRVKDLIDYCNTNYPNAKLVFMTTLPRRGYLTQIEAYRTAIIETCRVYGAYCLDINGQSGISLYSSELESKWCNGDGCHYLQPAHDRVASLLISYLESII